MHDHACALEWSESGLHMIQQRESGADLHGWTTLHADNCRRVHRAASEYPSYGYFSYDYGYWALQLRLRVRLTHGGY